MTQDIPVGRTKEDIKAREQIIKEFYAHWIGEHPDKKVLNVVLGKYICVKFLSINETYEKASRSYESTLAVFKLTEILQNATLIEELPAKRNRRKCCGKVAIIVFFSYFCKSYCPIGYDTL